MFANWTISRKLKTGFGVTFIIACLLGGYSYYSIIKIRQNMDIYDKWTQIDLVLNRNVIENVLELNRSLAIYSKSQDQKDAQKIISHLDRTQKAASHWNTLVKDNDLLTVLAAKTEVYLDRYKSDFTQYVESCESCCKTEDIQREVVARSLDYLFVTMENVIDPAKSEAEQAEDIPAMVKWSAIDMVMNEAVIANVLKLQTAALNYAYMSKPKNWDSYLAYQSAAYEGLAQWRETIGDQQDMQQAADVIEQNLNEYAEISQQFQSDRLRQQNVENGLITSGNDLISELMHSMDETVRPATLAAMDATNALQQRATGFLSVTIIVSLAITVVMSYVIISSINRSLGRIIKSLDLSSSLTGEAAAQVSQTSQTLAHGSTEAAAGVEETASNMEELTEVTRLNAETSEKVSNLIKQARICTDQGNEAMATMLKAIAEIKDSSDQTKVILKTIDEIAFQTNLLALNAAVEAARAGEAGKGFAVVAEEVRSLAQRSAEAARDTAALLEKSSQSSDKGVEISSKVDQSLSQIAEDVNDIDQLIEHIREAATKQAGDINYIASGVHQVDNVVQTNASASEESAAAAEELSSQAVELQRMVVLLCEMTGIKTNKQSTSTEPVAVNMDLSDSAFHGISEIESNENQLA